MNKLNKEETILKINHKGELLIWLVVVMFFVALYSLGIIFKETHEKNDYRIFLQDVDGLTVGSAVRMMGVEVGYVKRIRAVKDEVYVKFIITNPDVYLPQGTKATVEFSGMAGSRSLELYPPKDGDYIDSATPVLEVLPPKRLHDALSLLNNMFKKLASISYTASSFGAKLEETGIKSTKDDIITTSENFKDFLQYSEKFLKESGENNAELMNSLKRLKKND